jgi:hypothetical protein
MRTPLVSTYVWEWKNLGWTEEELKQVHAGVNIS